MRNLNISYNSLDFDEKSKDFEDSKQFMVHLKVFLTETIFLNHVNLSGMNFKKEQILDIFYWLRNCKFLLGFHMNDNNICTLEKDDNSELFFDCLSDFNIKNPDLIECGRASNKTKNPVKPIDFKSKDYIDYPTILRPYFNL